MIYKCLNCEGNLVYSVEDQKMKCEFCGSLFEINELEEKKQVKEIFGTNNSGKDLKIVNTGFDSFNLTNENFGDYNTLVARKEAEKMEAESRAKEFITMQKVKCTSCGSELLINGVESSTFCAYCGQATIVMDRVDDYLKPDYIIPFKVNQEDAERIIRTILNDGFFVPKEVKNFQVEKLRGIYIPFWLMDFNYSDSQFLKYSKRVGKSNVTRYVFMKGECDFKRVTVDASLQLNDYSSQRLEPYDMRQLVDFNSSYLSGFYSDRFDDKAENLESVAVQRMKVLFDQQMLEDSGHPSARLVSSNPKYYITKTDYALLPAWFLSFKYDGKPFTIMVNGQTGKMVGAVPFVKAKAYGIFAGLSAVLSLVLIPLLSFIYYILWDPKDVNKVFFGFIILVLCAIIFVWSGSIKTIKRINESIDLTNSKSNNKYMKERQDS